MAIHAETLRTGDISSSAEFGKKTHAAIGNIVTKLQEIPEYKDAPHKIPVGRGIFDRIASETDFEKGGYHYFIGISYKPVSSTLVTDQFEESLQIIKHEINNPKNKISSFLVTDFVEDQEGKLEFTDGRAAVLDHRKDPQEEAYVGEAALEKTDEILEHLLTPSNP